MKIFRSALLTLAACLAAAYSAHAQEKLKLDVKTKLLEKPGVTAIKNGTVLLVMQSEWAEISEFNEDYALWLRNPKRETHGDSVTLTLDMELRSPSLFSEGDLLDSERITVTYAAHGDWRKQGTPEAVKVIDLVEGCGGFALAVAKAFHPVSMLVAETAVEAVLPGDVDQMNMEAMVVGAKVLETVREMGAMREGKSEKAKGKSEEEKRL
jgi:hypothetical protein